MWGMIFSEKKFFAMLRKTGGRREWRTDNEPAPTTSTDTMYKLHINASINFRVDDSVHPYTAYYESFFLSIARPSTTRHYEDKTGEQFKQTIPRCHIPIYYYETIVVSPMPFLAFSNAASISFLKEAELTVAQIGRAHV